MNASRKCHSPVTFERSNANYVSNDLLCGSVVLLLIAKAAESVVEAAVNRDQ